MRENSGKSAKSLKIDRNPQNTSKFARNLIKYSHVNFSQATIIKGAHFSIFLALSTRPKINLYPLNNAIGFLSIYPLDSGLSNG